MTHRWILLCLSFAFVTAAFADDTSDDRRAVDDVVPGVVLVQFRADIQVLGSAAKTGVASFDGIAAKHQVYAVEKALPFLDAVASKRALSERATALQRVYVVRYSGPRQPQRVAAALARDPNVVFAEPQYVYRTTDVAVVSDVSGFQPVATPDDAQFGNMSHLPRLNMPEAWDVVKGEQGKDGQGNDRVVVAIIDGGTDWRHPDLEANIWTNPGEVPDNGFDDDGNGFVDDIHGWNFASDSADPTGLPGRPSNGLHGTAVAGAAVAVTNNAIGVAGTSWNAQLMAVNAGCPNQDGLICGGFQGILYAAVTGADIINASWGGNQESEFGRQVIETAIEEGALVVAAAGNDGNNSDQVPFYPANYISVLSVGGTRKTSDVEGGFNYGKTVNTYAPGRSIDSTTPNGQYQQVSGTSFASPLVAGVAALVKTLHPELTPHQLREQIRLTSDDIDVVNPSRLSGQLGRGRTNALRAVTEAGVPAIRMIRWSFEDEDGNLDLRSGETVDVTATFINYLDDATNVTLELDSDDTYISFPTGSVPVASLPSGDSTTVTFTFELASNAPNNRVAVFYTRASAGAYVDEPDVIRLPVNETAVASHSSGPLQVGITNEGNIGYLAFQGSSPGVGFVTNGRDVLFEGGLVIATGPGSVSDCVRGVSVDQDQNVDFVLKEGTALEVISPGPFTTQQGRVELEDSGTFSPIGLSILQESYMDIGRDYEDFIIFRYVISNTTDATMENLHVGLFFDWDIATDPSQDYARFDDTRQVGYIQNTASNPTVLAGTRVVSELPDDASVSYHAIDNPTEIYRDVAGGFTDQEKWVFLSDGIQRTTLEGTDASQITGAGPFTIDPGASIDVAFAVVAGQSTTDLLQNFDNAQALWGSLPVDVEEDIPAPVPGAFALQPVYPHPAVPPIRFTYDVAVPSDVVLTVYDVLGRKVRTMTPGNQRVGTHTITWDGVDEAGRRVADGLYMVRLTARGGVTTYVQSRQVVIVR